MGAQSRRRTTPATATRPAFGPVRRCCADPGGAWPFALLVALGAGTSGAPVSHADIIGVRPASGSPSRIPPLFRRCGRYRLGVVPVGTPVLTRAPPSGLFWRRRRAALFRCGHRDRQFLLNNRSETGPIGRGTILPQPVSVGATVRVPTARPSAVVGYGIRCDLFSPMLNAPHSSAGCAGAMLMIAATEFSRIALGRHV